MHLRVTEELSVIRKRFPDLEHGDQFDWVVVPVFPLPQGRFNKSATKLLFRIPPGYPQTGPDNFFVDGDLRLASGQMPPAFNSGSNSSSGAAPIKGEWGWFSWHPQGWRPAANISAGDNLEGFIRSVQLCLRGEESA